MNEFLSEYMGVIVSAVATGSLTWVATIKWTRKQAEADATKSVQDVYQELIEDLKKDREELKTENQSLREELRSIHSRMVELENKCNENTRRVEDMIPYLCYCKNCPNRIANKE